jgi:hypothetical protein
MAPAKSTALAVSQNSQSFVPPLKTEYFEPSQVIEVLHQSRGILTRAAEKLGCSRATIQNYCERYPEVAQARIDGREMLLDAAEGGLVDSVEKGEEWGVRFALATIGKHRGYTYPQAKSMTMVETDGNGNVRVIQVDSSGPIGELGDADLVSQMKNLVASQD